MAQAGKLVSKLKRRQRKIREATESVPKMDKCEEILQDSPTAQKLMRGAQRRMDQSWGYDFTGHEPALEYRAVVSSLQRQDFDPGPGLDFGLLMTFPGDLLTDTGLQSGDSVQILSGDLEGRMLEVVEVLNSTQVRLDDVASYAAVESNVPVRMLLSAVKKSYV